MRCRVVRTGQSTAESAKLGVVFELIPSAQLGMNVCVERQHCSKVCYYVVCALTSLHRLGRHGPLNRGRLYRAGDRPIHVTVATTTMTHDHIDVMSDLRVERNVRSTHACSPTVSTTDIRQEQQGR